MIYNTTSSNLDYEIAKKQLGKPYSLIQKIKGVGGGSGRMMIASLSEKLQSTKPQFDEIDYANIEWMPKGILVHYTNRLDRFTWIVPFHQLVIYNSSYYSIHANGHRMQLHKNKKYQENKKYLDKVIDAKNAYLGLEYYDKP